MVQRGEKLKLSRTQIFSHIQRAARAAAGNKVVGSVVSSGLDSVPVPFLDEPWYCCAEPMDDQFVAIGESKPPSTKADRFV